jgi:acetyl esterase/lipase
LESDIGFSLRNSLTPIEWLLITEQFLSGGNVSNMTTPAPLNASSVPVPDSQTSEDCLFLDVFVPQKVFSEAGCEKDHRHRPKKGGQISLKFPIGTQSTNIFYFILAAVLVWIYGGGYVTGTKSYYGSAASLVSRSMDNDGEGIIFVELNYRLGLFVRILFR